MAAVPSVALVLKLIRTLGVVSLVLAATVKVGAWAAMVSSAWLCAVAMPAKSLALLMALDASAMALSTCAEAPARELPSMLSTVLESARLRVLPLLLALLSSVTRLATTVDPAPVTAFSARVMMVATCAAAFCAVRLPAAYGS